MLYFSKAGCLTDASGTQQVCSLQYHHSDDRNTRMNTLQISPSLVLDISKVCKLDVHCSNMAFPLSIPVLHQILFS